MKFSCDHCSQTVTGSLLELLDAGWARITIDVPIRMTFTACPDHTHEMTGAALAAIDAEHQRRSKRRTLGGVLDG